MQKTQRFAPFVLVPVLLLLIAACGDVGDAPEAQVGDAVEVSELAGDTYVIDSTRSELKWRAAKVTRAHDGGFRDFSGVLTVADGQVAGVDVTIDTRSIWSDTERLTGHLKSPDFFEVERYPEATFRSASVTPIDSTGATHLVSGNLTMHGQTNGVTFPATIHVQNGEIHASADFIINRTDWGINYTGQADDLIENNVRLIFELVAVPQQTVAEARLDEAL